MLPGPQGPQKVEIYEISCDPGLNYEPRLVFCADFEYGIETGWKVDKNKKMKKKTKKKSCDPGLNHAPRVVFYAEFESGIIWHPK